MTTRGPHLATVSDLPSGNPQRITARASAASWRLLAVRLSQPVTARVLAGVALLLLGAAAGAAGSQRIVAQAAHHAGACAALRMAAALGYLDAEQQRRVRNALVTAINPDADLFAGFRPSAAETCSTGTDG
jgi:hypothetical protein